MIPQKVKMEFKLAFNRLINKLNYLKLNLNNIRIIYNQISILFKIKFNHSFLILILISNLIKNRS